MEKIPKLIHFYHDTPILPFDVSERIMGFRRLNPEFAVKVWNNDSARTLDIDLDWVIKTFPTSAGVSNVVRLAVLAKHSGLYFDTDFMCHKPLDCLVENYFAIAAKQDHRICNAFMGAPMGNSWIRWQLEHINEYEGQMPDWGVTLASNAPLGEILMIEKHLIYPYNYDSPTEQRHPHSDSLVEHLWHGSWIKK